MEVSVSECLCVQREEGRGLVWVWKDRSIEDPTCTPVRQLHADTRITPTYPSPCWIHACASFQSPLPPLPLHHEDLPTPSPHPPSTHTPTPTNTHTYLCPYPRSKAPCPSIARLSRFPFARQCPKRLPGPCLSFVRPRRHERWGQGERRRRRMIGAWQHWCWRRRRTWTSGRRQCRG